MEACFRSLYVFHVTWWWRVKDKRNIPLL